MSAARGQQSVDWSTARLGRSVRAIRLARGLSIKDLASESELSASFLSQVETGQSDLSVGRLLRVAQTLGVTAADILELPSPGGGVLRAAERTRLPISADGVTVYMLASTIDKKRTFSIASFDRGARIAMPVRNRGSEYFIYVLSGAISLETAGGGTLTLEQGDSLSRASEETRSLANASEGSTTFIWSQAPRPGS